MFSDRLVLHLVFTQVSNLRDGTAREQQTVLINQLVRKNDQGKYVIDTEAPRFKEIISNVRSSYFDDSVVGETQTYETNMKQPKRVERSKARSETWGANANRNILQVKNKMQKKLYI